MEQLMSQPNRGKSMLDLVFSNQIFLFGNCRTSILNPQSNHKLINLNMVWTHLPDHTGRESAVHTQPLRRRVACRMSPHHTFQALYDSVGSLSTHTEFFSIRDWNHLTITRSSLVTDGVYHMVKAEDIASQEEEVEGREEEVAETLNEEMDKEVRVSV